MYFPRPFSSRLPRALSAFFVVISVVSSSLAVPPEITVTSYGAAEKVSGSLHALQIGDTKVIVDAGLEYAEKQNDASAEGSPQARTRAVFPLDAGRHRRRVSYPRPPRSRRTHPLAGRLRLFGLDLLHGRDQGTPGVVVVESQIHFDREVVRNWYFSAISRDKALENKKSFTVHWMPDCPFGNRIHTGNRRTFKGSQQELSDHIAEAGKRERFQCCRECEKRNVDAIMRLVKTVKTGEPQELSPGVTFEFLPTGHLPGSAAVLFEAKDGDDRCRLLFSGDIGNGLSPLRDGPPPAPEVDFVAIETTYGARIRPPETKNDFERFRRVIGDAVKDGRTVLIPAFSLDRTQAILYQLHLARQEGRLPADAPVYCPSPTARRYTEIYERNRPLGWFPEAVAKVEAAWSPDAVLSRVPDSKTLRNTPLIYLTSNNLGDAGWSRKLLEDLLPRDDVHLLFRRLSRGGDPRPPNRAGRQRSLRRRQDGPGEGNHRLIRLFLRPRRLRRHRRLAGERFQRRDRDAHPRR